MKDGNDPDRPGPGGGLASALKAGRFCISLPDRAQNYLFDRRFGVATMEPVLTIGSVSDRGGENCPYSGASWLPVRRMLKSLSPGQAGVFVDLGSGKGKVLLIAGCLPYKRAIGVEIDEILAERA